VYRQDFAGKRIPFFDKLHYDRQIEKVTDKKSR